MLKKKVFFSFSASLLSIFVTLFSIAYLTTITTLEEFATVSVILVIYSFLAIFDVFRVPAINILSSRPKLAVLVVSSLFQLTMRTAVLASFISGFIMFFFYGLGIETIVVFFSTLFFLSSPFLWVIIDAAGGVVISAWCRAISQSLLYLSLIFLDLYTLSYFWAMLVSSIVLFSLLLIFTPNKKQLVVSLKTSCPKNVSNYILRNSISVFYHYISSTIVANFERFLCFFIGGPVLFAIATAFTEFSNRATFFSRVLNIAIYPTLSKWKAIGEIKKCKTILYNIDIIYFLFFISVFVIFYIFSNEIIVLIFSEEFLAYRLEFLVCIMSGVFRLFSYQSIIRFNLLGDFFTQSIYSSISALLAILCLSYAYIYPASLLFMVVIIKLPEIVMFFNSIKILRNAES